MPNPGRNPPSEPLSSMYTDTRCRQLEGTFPGDPTLGVWVVSAARIWRGWGNVKESDWPFVHIPDWPGVEPVGLDAKAKWFRVHHYQRIRSSQDCRFILADNNLPVAAFEITNQWFDAPGGVIRMPNEDDEIIGSHAVAIVGFDLSRRCFRFVNSWGEEWGAKGFGYLPFAYFDKYLVEAWALHDYLLRDKYAEISGVDWIRWGNVDVLGHSLYGGDILHGGEVYDGNSDELMGWTFAVHRDGYLDIEELFVRPQYRQQGIANQLIEMLLELSEKQKRPMRLWIPFADWTAEQMPRVERIVGKLGLKLFDSGVGWAAAVGVDSQNVEVDASTEVGRKTSGVKPMFGLLRGGPDIASGLAIKVAVGP